MSGIKNPWSWRSKLQPHERILVRLTDEFLREENIARSARLPDSPFSQALNLLANNALIEKRELQGIREIRLSEPLRGHGSLYGTVIHALHRDRVRYAREEDGDGGVYHYQIARLPALSPTAVFTYCGSVCDATTETARHGAICYECAGGPEEILGLDPVQDGNAASDAGALRKAAEDTREFVDELRPDDFL